MLMQLPMFMLRKETEENNSKSVVEKTFYTAIKSGTFLPSATVCLFHK